MITIKIVIIITIIKALSPCLNPPSRAWDRAHCAVPRALSHCRRRRTRPGAWCRGFRFTDASGAMRRAAPVQTAAAVSHRHVDVGGPHSVRLFFLRVAAAYASAVPLLGTSRSHMHSDPVTAAQCPAEPLPTASLAELIPFVARLELEACERGRRRNDAHAAWASVDCDVHAPRLDIGDLQVVCIPARVRACKCHRVHVVTDELEQSGQPPSNGSRILASISRESKSKAEHGRLGARTHSLQHVGSSLRKPICSEKCGFKQHRPHELRPHER